MNSNISQQASLAARLKVWFAGLPLVTRAVFVLCVGIYALQLLTGQDDFTPVCLSAYRTLAYLQVYRLITSAVFHVGLLHIAFNMLAFVPIAKSLERSLGSVQFGHLMLLIVVLGGSAYVLLSYAVAYGPFGLGAEFLHRCAVGLSGLVFGLIVVDNAQSAATHRSIFGFFQVPAKLYPWALMVFWQLVMPGVSFLGHLCGVLMGQLYVWGYLNRLMLSGAAIQWLEAARPVSYVYNLGCFIAHTGGSASLPMSSLPVSRNASIHGEAGDRSAGWFRSGWMPVPTSEPSPQASGSQGAFVGKGYTLSGSSAGPPQGGSSSHTKTVPGPLPSASSRAGHTAAVKPSPTFTGRGHVVGGQAPTLPPSAAVAAAAAAAEARMARHICSGSAGAAEVPGQPAGSAGQQEQPDLIEGPFAAALQQLEAMGFPRPAASAALDAADGDVQTAVELLSAPT
ncbi:hypothetical protein WJX72_008009 [[Myrmecia] bisecta]|uniref:UBA domain-containing protein n=1 Tax=[Myrmecia] bisecta TaxID=41462 RepID=A0AAW1PHK5_9CHLO